MRRPIIAGNWKMHKTIAEAIALVREMRAGLEAVDTVDRVVCPPYLALPAVTELLKSSPIKVGAQNMFWEEQGAYTGEVSPLMVKEICTYVILGHSERRQYFGETDKTVNKRLKAALAHGLKPIVCVGENLAQNEAGETDAVVSGQVKGCLEGLTSAQAEELVIAYEPVWAIGTGRAATAEGAGGVIRNSIRGTIASLYDESTAQAIRVQYGGSVDQGQRRRVHGASGHRRRSGRRRLPEASRYRGDRAHRRRSQEIILGHSRNPVGGECHRVSLFWAGERPMVESWTPVIALVVIVAPLLWLKRWITLHLQGLGLLVWGNSDAALVLYFLALFPGILLHEVSHWLFAKAVGVRTGKVSLWPQRQKSGRVRLGSVELVRSDPFRSSLIGLAPLITGSLSIFLIGDKVLSLSQAIDPLLAANWQGAWAGLSGYTQAPDFWLWLYVVFAISNAMFPSESDRQSWLMVLLFAGAIGLAAFASGLITQVPTELIGALMQFVRYLTYAFALTVVVDVVFGLVIAAIEKLLERVRGMRVEY